MTLAMAIPMADSITPGNLPPYPAYLVYVDGLWKTAGPVHAAHPTARLLTMTVLGGTELAEGCDCEPGDLDAASAARWLRWRAGLTPGFRPVLYASRDGVPEVLAELPALGMARGGIRILSAHYGQGEHICSPSACGAGFEADGTQWTSQFTGLHGSKIDMSALLDDFFGATAPPTRGVTVQVQLGVLAQGSSGQQVRNWQALLVAHGYGYMIAPSPGTSVEAAAGVDGVFGAKTAAATAAFRAAKGIAGSGVDGAAWAAALG